MACHYFPESSRIPGIVLACRASIAVMSTDVNRTRSSIPSPAAAEPIPTIVIPVNQPTPLDTGIRVEVQRVPLSALAKPAAPAGAPHHLPSDVAVLQRMVMELLAAMEGMRQENTDIRQRFDELVRWLHAPRPERFNPNQPLLFAELQPNAAAPPATEAAVTVETPPASEEPESRPKTKEGHGRRRLEDLLPSLPTKRVEHTLTEAERLCPSCGGTRRQIGEQTTQQLEYEPARLIRIEHAQFTYSCPHCPEHIVTAPKPPQPIDRGLPGPGLLAAVVTHKYDEHQPLYRQELSLWRHGLFLSRSTTCEWMAAVAELLQPLIERMKHDLLQSRVIQTDSTPVDVLIDGQAQAQTGHFWPHLGDAAHPQVVIHFSLDGTKEHALAFLANYSGYVQADASSGYDILFVPDGTHRRIEVGCWAHTERKFAEHRDSDPKIACQSLGFIKALFAIEQRARRDHLSEEDVLILRQHESLPILAEFKTWVDATTDLVLPKSPMGEALGYVRNQWTALNRYTEAGFLEMTNNASERTNKLMAIGRKNWLFVGSANGGKTAAVLFSITATCRRLQIDVFAYLFDLLTHLPILIRARASPEQLDDWLPHRWLARHPEARYPLERRRQSERDRRDTHRDGPPL